METFGKSHSQYLDPPDEPEAVFCEDCGNELEQIDSFGGLRDMKCVNPYCPAKHEGVAKEMAEMLIGAQDEVEHLARKLKTKTRELDRIVEAYSNSGLE